MKTLFKGNGYSLTEIVIAVAILGLVLVVICSVFFKSLMGIKRGQTGGTAMYIANKKIDEVRSLDLGITEGIYINEVYQHIEGYDPPPADLNNYISWNPAGAIPQKTITGKEGPTGEYKFTVEIKNYIDGGLPVENLKLVTVEVKWFDSLLKKEKNLKVDTLLARKAY